MKIEFSEQAQETLSRFSPAEQTQIKNFLSSLDFKRKVKPRSKLFRALGMEDPPIEIEINHQVFQRLEIFKHDSWAATALYGNPTGKVVCKFNRQQPIFGLPMNWLGVRLASRENKLLKLLADSPYIPRYCGEVKHRGNVLVHVSAHDYVEGLPLRRYQHKVSDDFFPKLEEVLTRIHQLKISYMDMNKQENILVKTNGDPCLIDFQICFHSADNWFGRSRPMKYLLKLLQESDRYHLMKHYTRFRPDLFTPQALEEAKKRPWFLNIYRCVQIPLRTARRKLLVYLGFRDKTGQVFSESFVEDGMRNRTIQTKNLDYLNYRFAITYHSHQQILQVASISNPKC